MESTPTGPTAADRDNHFLGTWARIYLHGFLAFAVFYAAAYVVTLLVPIFDFTGSRPVAILLDLQA